MPVGFVFLIHAAFQFFCTQGHAPFWPPLLAIAVQEHSPALLFSATKRFQTTYLGSPVSDGTTDKTPITIQNIQPGFVKTRLYIAQNFPWHWM